MKKQARSSRRRSHRSQDTQAPQPSAFDVAQIAAARALAEQGRQHVIEIVEYAHSDVEVFVDGVRVQVAHDEAGIINRTLDALRPVLGLNTTITYHTLTHLSR